MTGKITKTAVDAAKPAEKSRYLWDSTLKGFGVLVLPSGVKSYVYQYRNAYGRSRRATIGRHGVITAEQARAKAQALAAAVVVEKRDVVDEQKARRNAHTVGDLFSAYLQSARFAEKAESTRAVDKGRIERHLRPRLGDKVLLELKREDVRRAFAAIRDGATATDERTGPRGRAIVRGGQGTARMAVRLLRATLSWAAEEGLVTENVATGVKIGSDGTRNVTMTPREYEALFKALDKLEQQRQIRAQAADAIRLIALTGARRGEVTGLQWQHVDLKRGLLVLPASRHKAGARTGKPREIALPAAAQAIIARQESGRPDALVFTPAKGEGVISLSKPWRLVREAAKLPDGVGLHGLRHALASTMALQGAQAAEIMVALGHRQLSTTQRYIAFSQDSRVQLLNRHTAGIAAAMNPKKKRTKAKVVRLGKARR